MKITTFYERIRNVSCDYANQGVERDILIGEFLKHYYDAIKKREDKEKKELSPVEEDDVFITLINDSTLKSISDSSTALYLNDKNKWIVKDFWIDALKKIGFELAIKFITTIISLVIAIYFLREPIMDFLIKLIHS